MSLDRIKWMAAIPYLFVLLMVINGNILGNYDLYFFGVQLSLITLVPYLIYHFVNKNHENDFVSSHTKAAMRIFRVYFFLTVIISVVMNLMGFGLAVLDPIVFFTSGLIGLALLLPLLFVVIYAIFASTLGSIRSFKLLLPNKSSWLPEENI